jgi:hypothetical protein
MADDTILVRGQEGEQVFNNGASGPMAVRTGKTGEMMFSEVMPRYAELARKGRLFSAYAIVTAPVIWSTAAGTGGPLLWNGGTANAYLIAAGFGTSVVSTVAGALGIATGTSTAPGTTTAIDASGPLQAGGAAATVSAFRIGTVSAAASNFMPFAQVHTGALTVDSNGGQWTDLGGMIMIPPGKFASISGSATLTTLVAQLTLVWAELPA